MRILVLPLLAATTWYVKPGANGTGTAANPFGTVQAGVDAADAGDTVELGAGTYVENVNVAKSGVTLVATTAGTAIIDGERGAGAGKPALSIIGGDWSIFGVVLVDGGARNLWVRGAASAAGCNASGGVTLQGVQTGGVVRPTAGACTGSTDAGSFNSYDVDLECLGGPVVVNQSTLLADACVANLYLDAVGPSVLVAQNEMSGGHGYGIEFNKVDGGEVTANFVHSPCCDGFLGTDRNVSAGMHVVDSVQMFFHHNLLVGTGQYGIAFVDNSGSIPNEEMIASNNTLVGEECGVRFNAVSGTAHSNLVAYGQCTDAGCDTPCDAPCAVYATNQADGGDDAINVGFDLFHPSVSGVPYCLDMGQTMVDAGPVTLASPRFVNGGQGDFHLSSNSPAIDQGDPSAPPGVDFDGNPEPVAGIACGVPRIDIGCYEYQPPNSGPCDAGVDAGAVDAGGVDAGSGGDAGTILRSPTASISPAMQTIDAGMSAGLNATASTPSTGASLAAFDWQLIEGPTGLPLQQGPTQSLTFTTPGTYIFQLVVQDTSGLSSSPARATVVVVGAVPEPTLASQCGCGESGTPVAALALLLALALRALRGTGRAAPAAASVDRRRAWSARSARPRARRARRT